MQTAIDHYLVTELPKLIAEGVQRAIAQQSVPGPELEIGEAAGGGNGNSLPTIIEGQPNPVPSGNPFDSSKDDRQWEEDIKKRREEWKRRREEKERKRREHPQKKLCLPEDRHVSPGGTFLHGLPDLSGLPKKSAIE